MDTTAAATQHCGAANEPTPSENATLPTAAGSPAQAMLRQDSAADRHGSGAGGSSVGGCDGSSNAGPACLSAADSDEIIGACR